MLIEKTHNREKKFWAKVNKSKTCWEWTGCLSTTGYGRFGTVKVTHYAHRVSYEWYNGPINEQYIRHKCDNPKCVRPDHLESGTPSQNSFDMSERWRHVGARKISPEDVVSIRWRKFHGESTKSLSREHNLSTQQINAICRGKFWPKYGGPKTRPQ